LERLRLGVMFGGRSGEHEVSLMSARSVLGAIDPKKYEVVPIGISKKGDWLIGPQAASYLQTGEEKGEKEYVVILGSGQFQLVSLKNRIDSLSLDVIFPLVHGTYGEDGCIQGLLEILDIPYVGCGVLASAVGMDKGIMKMLFAQAGLPQIPFLSFKRRYLETHLDRTIESIARQIGFPCFVKPANLGSSVGISKVREQAALKEALLYAARFDGKVLVEKGAEDCLEVEVSVLGNETPKASIPGQIIPINEFYDYQAKYLDKGSQLIIPANISDRMTNKVRELAIQAFKAIDGSGMARVDFFVKKDESIVYVNEINTIPGFTEISMYPKLWQASGIKYSDLLDELIELALDRYKENARSLRSYEHS
jgi:D-alanine-D-alanine ligase